MSRMIWLAILLGFGVVLYSSKPTNVLTLYSFTGGDGSETISFTLKSKPRLIVELEIQANFAFEVTDWGLLNFTRVFDRSSGSKLGNCVGALHYYLCAGFYNQRRYGGKTYAVLVNERGDWSFGITRLSDL